MDKSEKTGGLRQRQFNRQKNSNQQNNKTLPNQEKQVMQKKNPNCSPAAN